MYPAPLHVVTALFSYATQSRSGSLPAPPPHEATGHRGSRKGKPLVGGRAGSRQGLEEKKRLEEAQTVNKY